MRGFLIGALTLIALEVLVSSKGGPDAVTGLSGWAAQIAERFLNPNVPAIGPVGAQISTQSEAPANPVQPTNPAPSSSTPAKPATPWWAPQPVGVN